MSKFHQFFSYRYSVKQANQWEETILYFFKLWEKNTNKKPNKISLQKKPKEKSAFCLFSWTSFPLILFFCFLGDWNDCFSNSGSKFDSIIINKKDFFYFFFYFSCPLFSWCFLNYWFSWKRGRSPRQMND